MSVSITCIILIITLNLFTWPITGSVSIKEKDKKKKKKKKKKRNLEAYCIVFDLIGSFTKLESATESAIKTNTE